MHKYSFYVGVLLISLLTFSISAQAQIRNVDSLHKVYTNCLHDTCRATQYIWICESWYMLGKPDSSLKYAEKAEVFINELQKSQDHNIKSYLISAIPRLYIGLGSLHAKKNPLKSEEYYKSAIRIKDENNKVDLNHYTALHNYAGFLKNQGRKEESIPFYQRAMQSAEKQSMIKSQNKSKQALAEVLIYNNPDLGLQYLKELDVYYQQNDEYNSRGIVNKFIGMIYSQRGDYSNCISHYLISLDLALKYSSPTTIGSQYINVGSVYYNMQNYSQALEYFNKALEIGETNKLEVITAGAQIYFGTYYTYVKKDLEKAQYYLKSSRDLRIKLKMYSDAAYASRHLSFIYLERGDTTAAEEELKTALKGWLSAGDKRGEATANIELGRIKMYQGQYEEAERLAEYAKALSEEVKSVEALRESSKLLTEIAQATNRYDLALKNYKTFILMRDSINNVAQQREAIRKQLDYELDKKETTLRLEKEKQQISFMEELRRKTILFEFEQKQLEEKAKQEQLSLQFQEELKRKDLQSSFELENEKKRLEQEQKDKLSNEEKNRQRIVIIAVVGVLVMVVIFSLLIWNRFKVTKQQNIKIEEQKKLVELQRDEISTQHQVLGEKNKEIVDSITYAKRIQAAILPSQRKIKELLPDSFILYLPKDIVAGDFYWLESFAKASDSKGLDFTKTKNVNVSDPVENAVAEPALMADRLVEATVLFAAADCTGHGVPGAMVSVVCNNALNRSIREYGLIDPGQILDKTREIVIAEFEKSDEDVKDGMDISLCVLERKNKKLFWSGANNPLWIIRNKELIEYKPDKQPIGRYLESKNFTTHEIVLQENDLIYVFTDGYADQFGGEAKKKFKGAQLKKLLLSIQHLPLFDQSKKLHQEFDSWKGNLEQIDDVCIIGVRL